MPTRFLSDAELSQLAGFPADIAAEDLVTYFTLEPDDARWAITDHRGQANRLGLALQLCSLRWLGFVPDDLTSAPAAAAARLAGQLDVDPAALADYGGWQERTRTEHLREVLGRLGWTTAGPPELKTLEDFLAERALEHDSPSLLVRLACEHLRSVRVVRPGVERLQRWVAASRERAETTTALRLAPLLSTERQSQLDRLVVVDGDLGISRLAWLRRGATSAAADVIKVELDKLSYLRSLGADRLDLSVLPPGRRRFLAQVGRHSTAQALARADRQRRHPILLATMAEAAVEVLDELVLLFDQALSTSDSRARHQLDERLVERARTAQHREVLLDELLGVLADPAVPDEAVGALLRGRIGMEALARARLPVAERPRRDAGHLELLETRYSHLRSFAPGVLAALPLGGGPESASLLKAVEILKDLNATGRRRLPDDVPTDFVPTRWRDYLDATGDDHSAARRHYWELVVLYQLRDALRSGDVWVAGSRRYADPASYLIPTERWPPLRAELCQLTGISTDGRARLDELGQQIQAALEAVEPLLAAGDSRVRLDDDGQLIVSRLDAEELPEGAAALHDAAVGRLPHLQISSLLIEVDAWTGFTDALIHAGGATNRSPDLRRNLYAAVLAQATNRSLAEMSDATGISEDVLAWTTEWYLRAETVREANTIVVNRHHREPLAQLLGGGTLSSSDGQRFPQRGKSLTARALSRYFVDEGTTTLTHVADHHATYGTKVIPSTVPEASFTLDEILGNPTDLPIAEHTVDTAGQTLALFAAFDLVGLRFSPRIRDLPSRRLYRLGPAKDLAAYPHAGPLLRQRVNQDLIISQWDELLRLGGSLKFGHATASLLLAKLQTGSRHNALARGLLEYGRLIRTLFILRYLADPELQRRVHRQLNKGESLHALRRRILYANEGHIRRRHHDAQTEQALCLTLVTNAVVLFNTVYLQDALDALQAEGHPVTDDNAAHLSPALSDHINIHGSLTFDVERELARTGHRPLRSPTSRAAPARSL